MIRRFHLIATRTRLGVQVRKYGVVNYFFRLLFRSVRVFVTLLSGNRHCHPFSSNCKASRLFLQGGVCFTRLFRLRGAFPLTSVSVLRVLQNAGRNDCTGVVFVVAVPRRRTSQLCVVNKGYVLCVLRASAHRNRFVFVEGGLRGPSKRSNCVHRDRFKWLFSTTFRRVLHRFTRLRGLLLINFLVDAIIFRDRVSVGCEGVHYAHFSDLKAHRFLKGAIRDNVCLLVRLCGYRVNVRAGVGFRASGTHPIADFAFCFSRSNRLRRLPTRENGRHVLRFPYQ